MTGWNIPLRVWPHPRRDKWALAESESYLAVLYKEAAPYPFCRHPEKCYGKGYCPRDIACND